jgi:nitrous-oxide reductase
MNQQLQRRIDLLSLTLVFLVSAIPFSFAADKPNPPSNAGPTTKLPADVAKVIQERGLKPDDILGAVSTFVPSGRYDDYLMFASGGHSGQVFVIGLPSMRLLRTIAVFEAESWQGYGFGVKESPMMNVPTGGDGQKAGWADTHHPALSETNGDYDGQFLFIGDKSHGRIAVIDLRDFETKQFADGTLMHNDHGGCFVTPNTEYVIEGAQYAEPLGGEYAPISEYKEKYRGLATFWKFDRQKGRIDIENSFAIELPPYWQDLADAGKGPSDGWVFMNSFNTEMATGGIEQGNPPFEAGTAQRDMDYMHVFNWKKAENLITAGKFETKNSFKLITLKTAIDEGVLFFVPEPKSPHGVDVTPSGKFMVVAGKLDPHVTVYSFEKILKAIEAKDFEGNDEYGVPIIRFDAAMEAQVELGLGPLHTQFDDKGYAYTSLFLESAVARWSLGNDKYQAPEKPWTLVGKVPVQFNIGHLATAEGDTVSPDGGYLVALNKWSVDRFSKLGPLLPQNLQLVDIAKTGDTLKVLYDMPMGSGEPHYAQIIRMDKLKTWDVYPEVGWNTLTQSKSDKAVTEGKVIRDGHNVEIYMPLIRSHFDPEHIEIEQGQHVTMYLTNLERTLDATHGFSIAGYNIAASIEPGETVTIEFTADKPGVYPFYCLEFCSALHLEMAGYLMVKPKE